MSADSDRWNRVYDKIEDVHERITESANELARVAQQMADHVDSDTKCFASIDKRFDDLNDKLDDLCLSKAEAKRTAGRSGAILGAAVSLLVGILGACATYMSK